MIRPLAPEVRSRLRSGIATPTVAQCVEELVLNSIDAGATCVAIRVDIANYKIQVIDNGCGLDKNQMSIIGERYATSKCHDLKDLDNLSFFGYRGEALASISHISGVLEIVSRGKGSDVSYSKLFRNGKPSAAFESSKSRPSSGTTITVHSIFQNLPVRRKMLSPSLDYERVRKRIQGLALIQPGVSVTLRDDSTGTVSIQTHCTSSIAKTFGCLFEQDYSKVLKEVQHRSSAFTVHGYIGTKGHFNKKLQFVYVNKRIVLKTKLHKLANLLLGRSLISKRKVAGEGKDTQQSKDVSYSDLSSPGRSLDLYGMYVLNIDCSLSEYDITLDPGKTLVEFKNWSGILRCLEELILDFLSKENLTMKLDKPSPESSIEEVDFAQIGDDDSQEDDLEGMFLSEEATERIADLSERYGRGIHTSNCSNTLQSLTVRRGAVQNRSLGCDEILDELDDLDSGDMPNQSKAIDVEKDAHNECGGNFSVKNKQSPSTTGSGKPSAELLTTKAPLITGEILVISDSDKSDSRGSPNTITPSVESTCGDRVDTIPDSVSSCMENSFSSIQSDLSNKNTATPENGVTLSPIKQQPGLDSVETPRSNKTSNPVVIEISPDLESVHSSCPLPFSQNETENKESDSSNFDRMELHESRTGRDGLPMRTNVQCNEPNSEGTFCTPNSNATPACDRNRSGGSSKAEVEESSDTKARGQYHDGEVENDTEETSTTLLETCERVRKDSNLARMGLISQGKPIANNVSDTKTSEEMQRNRQDAECFDANVRSSENVFLKTPILHPVLGVHTQEQECRTECASDLEDENYKTPVGRCPPVITRKIGLLHTVSALRSFRYQKARENAYRTPNRNTKTSNDFAGQGSSIDQPSCHYQSSLHVFKQSVKPQCAVKEQNLEAGVIKPDQSSMLLLSKEHSVPLLGNTLLPKHCPSAAPSVKVPCQKTQVMRHEKDEQAHGGSRLSSNDVVQNIGNRKDSCSDPKPSSMAVLDSNCKAQQNVASKTTGSCIEQDYNSKQMDTNSSWNDKGVNRSDSTLKPAYKPRLAQAKPNLKRLRNQSNLESSVNTAERYIEKKDLNHPPEKVFLTSESFMVSAQDLLHKPTMTSGCRHQQSTLSSAGAKGVDSKDETSRRVDDVWSVIEEDCRNANKTIATNVGAILTASEFDSEKTNHDATQELSRKCAENLSRESCTTESHNLLAMNQIENFLRHRKSNIEHSDSATKTIANESIPAVDNLVTNFSVSNPLNPTENLTAGVDEYDKKKSNRNEKECMERKLRKDLSDCGQVNASLSTLIPTVDPVEDTLDHTDDQNIVSKLVSTKNIEMAETSCHLNDAPVQSTQSFSPSSRDILVATGTSDQESSNNVQKDVEDVAGTKCHADATPVQSTQSFSPSSRDILVETMTSDQESNNIVQKDHDGEDVANTTRLEADCSESDKVLNIVCNEEAAVEISDAKGPEADSTRMESESDTVLNLGCNEEAAVEISDAKGPEADSTRMESESDKVLNLSCNEEVAFKISDVMGPEVDSSETGKESESVKLLSSVNNEEVAVKVSDIIGPDADFVDTGTETEADQTAKPVDNKWVSRYDSKKGQIVYVNVQTGNCSMENPNQEGNQEGGEGRKDFKDGAGASSSVNAFMTNTGQVHPHLSHNATPFLPRNKRQRLGVCDDNSTEQMSVVTSKAVDKLMDKHLEKEDQEISSKWREGAKESDVLDDGDNGDNFQQLLSQWSNPTYGTMETCVLDIRSNQTSANAVKIHGTLHPYKFTKAMFQNIKVIGQVDNKFIACMLDTEEKAASSNESNLLILIDQHAAHERVRLEQLTADAYEEELSVDDMGEGNSEEHLPAIKTSSVLPPVQITLSAEDVRLIKVFKPKLQRLGVGIHLPIGNFRGGKGDVEITHLPACMVEREAHELRRGRQPVALTMVESLIKEQLDLLQDTSGACAVLPKTITKLLNSQACHGAIKFGDKLADHECLTLIGQLSQCDLPFQCAHGRPSLIPILDIKLLASKLQANETDSGKPRLWKLKKGLQREDRI